MNRSLTTNELKQILAAWCNGTIEPTDQELLNSAIETDPAARQLYLEYVATESELHATYAGGISDRTQRSLNVLPEITLLLEDADNEEAFVRPSSPTETVDTETVRKPASFLNASYAVTLAASLIGIATLLGVAQLVRHGGMPFQAQHQIADATSPLGQELPEANGLAIEDKASSIARITASRNCRWADPSQGIGYGTELQAGTQLILEAGLAEITFNGGARVILEGPAELQLASDAESILLRGRLSATLPAGVEVVPVRTPRMGMMLTENSKLAQLTQTGLRYGLSADSRGGDELHVFQGAMQAYLMTDNLGNNITKSEQQIRTVRLDSREAARIRPASTTVAKFFANRDLFVQSMSSTGGPQDGLYAYEGFDYPEGPLSGQNAGFGWAGAWADIEAACPPGQLATNVVLGGNLDYPEVRAIGGRAVQIAQQNRIRRALSTSLGGVFDTAGLVENQDSQRLIGANGKTIYLSFLQQVDLVSDEFYGFELHRGDGNGNRVFCVGHGAEESGYGVTSNFNAYGKQNYGRLGVEDTEVNFFIVKIEFGPFNSDKVSVYRNPDSLRSESELKPDTVLLGNFAFDRVSFGNFHGDKQHAVDELRIATTFRAVTGLRDRGDERLAPRFAQYPSPFESEQLKYSHTLLALAEPTNFVKQYDLLFVDKWN